MIDVGKKIFIRTVTYNMVGEVNATDDSFISLVNASWVADSGRWNNALVTGELEEVEPYPDGCLVPRGAIVDVTPWNHPLPTDVK